MELPREFDKRLAGFELYVGCVDDGKAAGGKAFRRDEMQNRESVVGGGEIVFVVRNEATAVVGRQDFGRKEMLSGKRGFTGARCSYEHDERQFWKGDLHWNDSLGIEFENRHLGWRAELRIFFADGQIADVVGKTIRLVIGPSLKFLTRPFEAVIFVTHFACR